MFGLIPWRKEMALPAEYPLAEVEREFRTLYNRLFAAWPAMFEEVKPERLWNLEVEETEKAFVVKMEVPGFEPEEFHLDLRGNKLFVKAEHTVKAAEPEKEPAKKPVAREERRYERVLTLPEGLDLEKVEATYRNGVLKLVLPRKEEALGRHIPVHA